MFFWNSLAFSMIQWMLAIWSLVPLSFLKPASTSGSSQFKYCWSLAWRILSITLLACEMSANKGPSSQGYGFSCGQVWMWELDCEDGWAPKNWCFWTVVSRLKAGGKVGERGWDGWMASLTQWTWVWASPGIWWWTGKPGMLQSMGSQGVGHNWATEQQ